MKYMLLVHHDEEAFGKFSENKQRQMLEESVTTDPSAARRRKIPQRVAAPSGGDGGHRSGPRRQTIRDRRSVHRNARADRRLLFD